MIRRTPRSTRTDTLFPYTTLLNPVGLFILLMSAAASSFGGLAGFISIGFAVPKGATETGFAVGRRWPLFVAGLLATLAFALILEIGRASCRERVCQSV